MWETFISWYINHYLGKYVENLNSQQLSFALRQGKLELENVPLKKNIFRSWGLPIEIRAGIVGRIKIEFNLFKYLRNEPVLITIEDIFLVAFPLKLTEWDPAEEEALAHESKMSSLDSHEGLWKAQYDLAANSSSYYSLYFSSMQIGASIVTKLVENLELNVENVHIRFELDSGNSGSVSFGIILKSLKAQSCDVNWIPLSNSSTGNNTTCSYKTLHLNELCIYCDPPGNLSYNFSEASDIIKSMREKPMKHDYLLCPVSAEARISKNNSSNPLIESSKPRFDFELRLTKVPLQLSDAQYKHCSYSYKSFKRLHRNCRLRHYRPLVPVKDSSSQWWTYAVRAILVIRGYKRRKVLRTWEEILERARDNVAFVNAYEQHLKQELDSSELRKLKDRIEAELHYDEIVALREIAMRRLDSRFKPEAKNLKKSEKVAIESSPDLVRAESGSTGVFSYIFPSWSNWLYSNPNETEPDSVQSSQKEFIDLGKSAQEIEDEMMRLRQSESELDESILDDVKSYGSDTLLARFRFILDKGVVTLLRKNFPFLELAFSNVEIGTELRPRTGSHKFRMSLASLSLFDHLKKCLLVSPHGDGGVKKEKSMKISPIFDLFYQMKANKKADHRISVTTKPLDIVIYPRLLKDINLFFSYNTEEDYLEVPNNGYEAMKEKTKDELRTYWDRLTNSKAALNYSLGPSLSWEIHLDISAPQIILYDSEMIPSSHPNFSSINLKSQRETEQKFLVFDLGRFRFSNMHELKLNENKCPSEPPSFSSKSDKSQNLSEEEDDEEFLTPCSSPVNEQASSDDLVDKQGDSAGLLNNSGVCSVTDFVSCSSFSRVSSKTEVGIVGGSEGQNLYDLTHESENQLRSKLYKKYSLEVTDIQLIIVEGKSAKDGSWKFTYSRPTSSLHFVDKFSINLEIERRLVYSEDPQWPALTLAGTLPQLNFHVNKSKILCLQTVINSYLSQPSSQLSPEHENLLSSPFGGSAPNLRAAYGGSLEDLRSPYNKIPKKSEAKTSKKKREESSGESSTLFMSQFTIEKISCEIQHRERSIAELQIGGARTTLSTRRSDTSLSFVIQSLLLVDAIQTFGPDFQLLLASHKHVSMDTVSGSLLDSHPDSPMSPISPSSPLPFSGPRISSQATTGGGQSPHTLSLPSELHAAILQKLTRKVRRRVEGEDKKFPSFGAEESEFEAEALITAELVLVRTEEENTALLSVQFNNLDVIANQETLMEILEFIKEVSPASSSSRTAKSKSSDSESSGSQGAGGNYLDKKWKTEASFDFNRLNVLLLRSVLGKDGNKRGRKIATATACDARVSCSIGGGLLKTEGSLGGLQMLNLTPEGKFHQRVLSVGKDPLIDETYNVFSPTSLFETDDGNNSSTTKNKLKYEYDSALHFTFEKPMDAKFGDEKALNFLKLKIASVIYTHSPIFLIDLKKCADQFQLPIGTKLKSAAAQIALGLVRQDNMSLSFDRGNSPSESFYNSLNRLNAEERYGGQLDESLLNTKATAKFKLDIILDSPIIALPRNRTSSHVLVANLGQITISSHAKGEGNSGDMDLTDESQIGLSEGTNYNILVKDVSLYSIDLKERWEMIANLKLTYPTSSGGALMRAQELYACDLRVAEPILHNTSLKFSVEFREECPPYSDGFLSPSESLDDDEIPSTLFVSGSVTNSLVLSLTPSQYAQIVESLSNVGASEEDFLESEIDVRGSGKKMDWEREIGKVYSSVKKNLHIGLHSQAPLPSPIVTDKDFFIISAKFEVSDLIVELLLPDDDEEIDMPHLCLSCSELSFNCEKRGYYTEMNVVLKSLTLEDTSLPRGSAYRLLANSQTKESGKYSSNSMLKSIFNRNRSLSTSCPDFKGEEKETSYGTQAQFAESYSFINSSCARTESSSLPDHLDPGEVFSGRFYSHLQRTFGKIKLGIPPSKTRSTRAFSPGERCPVTPPPSPRPPAPSFDNLVSIRVEMIDRRSPKFLSRHEGIHKKTHVEFNSLSLVLTPSSLNCLRSFFSERHQRSGGSETETQVEREVRSREKGVGAGGEVEENEENSEVRINAKALRLQLAGRSGGVAELDIVDISSHLVTRGKEFSGVSGRMGSLQVRDIGLHPGNYPVKFIFQGKEALNFDYCRKGAEAKFQLNMAAVLCIHTHRFYTEFYNIINSLFFKNNGLNEEDAIPTVSTSSSSTPSLRVVLNIQAGAPIIFIPYYASSSQVLVADFGHLSVRNKFIGEKEFAYEMISVDLQEMDLYSAELRTDCKSSAKSKKGETPLLEDEFKSWVFDSNCVICKTSTSSSLLKNKCALNLKVKRLLNETKHEDFDSLSKEASFNVHGTLSAVHATINLEKYKLIRGLLQYNIGEQIEQLPRSSTPVDYHRESISIEKANPAAPSNKDSKLNLAIVLELVNVTVELLKEEDKKLSCIDFMRSKFTFHNYADGTQDIDLESQEILVSDNRFSGSGGGIGENSCSSNVFTKILQQSSSSSYSKSSKNDPSSSSDKGSSSKSKLRAEVHLRRTSRGSNVTVLLNNMRLMVILDWWFEIQKFLTEPIPQPPLLLLEPNIGTSVQGGTEFSNVSPLLRRSKELLTPISVSAGIITKRAPVLDVPPLTFEFKINVSDCEMVVFEDCSSWDTNAIILKLTSILTYRPHLERPISCTIIESELFSCVLGIESETALSILDPCNVTLEIVRRSRGEMQGILDATLSILSFDKVLKIKSPEICLRLSYYDMKMFVKLVEKFTKEAQEQFKFGIGADTRGFLDDTENETNLPLGVYHKNYNFDEAAVDQLLLMGFTRRQSYDALQKCEGRLDDAALLLSSLEGAECSNQNNISESRLPLDSRPRSLESRPKEPEFLSGIEIKIPNFSLCVIDDCNNADVPLVELSLASLELSQDTKEREGRGESLLSINYYNRELCGWEPLVEPWACSLSWKQNERGELGKLTPSSEFPQKLPEIDISLTSKQILNINMTSTLLSLSSTVLSNWSAEANYQDKRRNPFVPFVLLNETGSPLMFTTIMSNNEEVLARYEERRRGPSDATSWMQVANGASQTFSFEGRGKLRHRNIHQLRTHQLVVRVNGWMESSPVSIDRVGTYFRTVRPNVNAVSRKYFQPPVDLPSTRLVFEVSLQGSAQKIVRIRSPLMVQNLLAQTMELKLENTIIYPAFELAQTGGSYSIQIRPSQSYPIPLHSITAQIWVRPLPSSSPSPPVYSYSTQPLLLLRSPSPGLRKCSPLSSERALPLRFCVGVTADEFPIDEEGGGGGGGGGGVSLVRILPPLTILNLLPYEVRAEVVESGGGGARERIGGGKKAYITSVDTSENVEISFSSDNFPSGSSLAVSINSSPFTARLKLLDTSKRPLFLNAKVLRGDGGNITVRLSSQYWIVNKSGLPIIVKQENSSGESAGQFQEHEFARNKEPLLFSFSDSEAASNISLRVGTGLHPPPAKPHWCRSFPLQNGVRMRKLIVFLSHSAPEVVYLVGIEVRDGRGRYCDSKIITIAPRFIVQNGAKRRMEICQRAFATSFLDPAAEATHLTLPPSCTLPFHWPRLDKDQLLCVRLLDVRGGVWSGGFTIENVKSFHLNVRDTEGECYFLRVETVLEGPTYFVVFSDTDQLPSPFRIDNLSLVPITFHQTEVGDERLKLTVKPESSFPYAWDEPEQSPSLMLSVPGGTSTIIKNLNDNLGLVAHMTYENFFYIALTATFPIDESESLGVSGIETLQLVLDVPEGSKVILRRKEAGNRNQLWRVNGDGLIEHEGSSPPRDPRKPLPPGSLLVLDIAGHATQPTQCVHLSLRKPDKRRSCTQHWEFTKDGRLKCKSLANMYVQAKDGFDIGSTTTNTTQSTPSKTFSAWQMWNEVVLGPPQPICYVRTQSGIPAEQAVGRQKLRSGSGRLSVYIDTDGPTRVLRLIDTEKPPQLILLNHTYEENSVNTIPRLLLNVKLTEGVGLDILSSVPNEELIYIRLSRLSITWLDTKESESVSWTVDNVQIDNQLFECEKSVVVYVTPSSKQSESESSILASVPALSLKWKRLKSRLNAHLFKELELDIKPLNIILEEKLLYKLCNWSGIGLSVKNPEELDESNFESQRAITNSTSLNTKRFYFGHLKITLNTVRLSVLTSSKLPKDLAKIKSRLGLTLIRFEEALVELDPFLKQHPFETFDFLLGTILKHYKDELLSQALLVLGSVDFLGNPVGFLNDVTVGVTSLINDGSVGGLLKNVAHGISNSTAKVTGSLGDGLTRTLALDDRHEEERRKIREESSSAVEPLLGGLRGLTHGVFGGITSIFTQTYEGAVNDGFTGIVTGLGKGIIGTVTKPAVGVLDLAAGAASSIRDSSRSSSRKLPKRLRLTRVVSGNGGLLPLYSEQTARGQELLYELNNRNYREIFIGCETVRSGSQDIRILVSSEYVTVFSPGKPHNILLQIPLKKLVECHVGRVTEHVFSSLLPSTSSTHISLEERPLTIVIVFTLHPDDSNLGITRPQVTVDSELIGKTVVQQVNYARILFEEQRHSQVNKPSSSSTED